MSAGERERFLLPGEPGYVTVRERGAAMVREHEAAIDAQLHPLVRRARRQLLRTLEASDALPCGRGSWSCSAPPGCVSCYPSDRLARYRAAGPPPSRPVEPEDER